MGSLFIFSIVKGKKVLKFCLQMPWKFKKFKHVKDGHALSIGFYLQSILMVPELNRSDVMGMASPEKWWCLSQVCMANAALPCLSACLPAHSQWNAENNWQTEKGLILPLWLQNTPVGSTGKQWLIHSGINSNSNTVSIVQVLLGKSSS